MRLAPSRLLIAGLLALSSSARGAGSIDLTVDLVGDPGRLTATSSLDAPPVGEIYLLVDGATGFTFDPTAALSPDYSMYVPDVLGTPADGLSLVSTAFGIPLLAPGQQVVLGHFQSASFGQLRLSPGDDAFGATLFGAYAELILPTTVYELPQYCDIAGCTGRYSLIFAVPEPAPCSGLAALGLVLLIRRIPLGRGGPLGIRWWP